MHRVPQHYVSAQRMLSWELRHPSYARSSNCRPRKLIHPQTHLPQDTLYTQRSYSSSPAQFEMADDSDIRKNPNGNTIIIAIIVPACCVVLLMTLLILHRHRSYLLPGLSHDVEAAQKAERMQLRREELEKCIKTESFYDWQATQKEKHPESLLTIDPVCAICLDEFDEGAQIRGLRCSHAFHTQCLDEWFGRYNEYCPLCHRTIIPGKKVVRARMMERPRPIPVAFMA